MINKPRHIERVVGKILNARRFRENRIIPYREMTPILYMNSIQIIVLVDDHPKDGKEAHEWIELKEVWIEIVYRYTSFPGNIDFTFNNSPAAYRHMVESIQEKAVSDNPVFTYKELFDFSNSFS